MTTIGSHSHAVIETNEPDLIGEAELAAIAFLARY